ncbi:zinc finger MYM-type protein 1-like [Daphnia magna]|uniref:zinc finger MYM-type protein 1-like n=1 Tax=Daphnia magna TaxID=35525 RepID=UPI001E1BBFD3|nr:zinc finger MYM-type protein 1-like [Daphnia magna]
MNEHEGSSDHRNAITTFFLRCEKVEGQARIDSQFVATYLSEKSYWKSILKRLLSVIFFLSSRGLAFRGSNQIIGSPKNGNYLGLLEIIAEYDTLLANYLKDYGNKGKRNVSYLSANICEEFIQLILEQVLQFIVKELKQAKYYSIIIDSTPDVSRVDQLTLSFRYVLENGNPVERFVGFIPMSGHSGAAMKDLVMETLEKLQISIEDCRGQSYDIASNMSGIYNGLQALIKERNGLAEYVPCGCHSLNLVGVCAAECNGACVDFFGLVQEINNFLSASTHSWGVLLSHLDGKKIKVPKCLSAKRWCARANAVTALREEYPLFKKVLDEIA